MGVGVGVAERTMKDLHQLFVLNAVGLLSRIYSKTADKPLPVRGSPGPVL